MMSSLSIKMLSQSDLQIRLYSRALVSCVALISSVWIFTGCDDDPERSPSGSGVVDVGFFRPESFDSDVPPRPVDTDAMMETRGDYGDPCESDDDCIDRVCVSSGDGKICSRSCILDCDPFPGNQAAYCRSDAAQGRAEFLCYPLQNLLCQPCLNDTQCDGAPCVDTADGRRCSKACEDEGDCPGDFVCDEGLCLPRSGSCECNTLTEGVTRICERGNQFGVCIGEETCDPELGWSGCDAQEPEAEVCDGLDQNCDGIPDDGLVSIPCSVSNDYGTCEGVSVCLGEEGEVCYGDEASEEVCDGLDNDCDGLTDETFTLGDGVYGLDEHCGGCDVSCAGRIPYATITRCAPEREPPTCVAVQCEPGYQSLDGEICVPAEDVLCRPCADDATCSSRSPGARCVEVGDPNIPETQSAVCARDCGPESLFGEGCPMGFECRAIGEAPDVIHQCLPTSGHCLCLGQPDGFSIPCSVTSPENEALSCSGRRTCEGDNFGACVLPQEVCDGIDNDCDGVIDNQFRSPTGRYEVDPDHCGRCNISCNRLNYANAEAVCDRTPETPRCAMRCLNGFVDLENGTDDGCECEVIPGVDLPDGLDQNCDGIDGDRALALFVSKVGSDDADGSSDAPLLTLNRALELAAGPNVNIRDIYVATGVYSENITLIDGVSVYGGYSLDFKDRDPEENPTTLLGRPPQAEERGTITASSIERETRVDGFSIYGANANVAGGNSVAVFIRDSGERLTLSNNNVIAGNGAPGGRGGAGASGALGRDGTRGDDAISAGTSNCQNQSSDGGVGGALTCGGVDVRGGSGGSGGCPTTQELNGSTPCSTSRPNQCRNSCSEEPCDPLPPPQSPGEAGRGLGVAAGGGPTYDRWNNSGSCSLCGIFPSLPHLGEPGENGPDGANGAAGGGCAEPNGYLNAEGEWTTNPGALGGAGTSGTGGGGGSSGSGFDVVSDGPGCLDNIGAGGGGGGSGGCGGAEGIGGQGGGGSFAILIAYGPSGVTQGLPQLTQNRITRGIGGQGGAGGAGGIGGLGGEGADGGIATGLLCAEPGGRGGNGGDGGHGGGGGGGCGGISVSVYLSGADGAPQTYLQQNNLIDSGRAGLGGAGGGSTGNPGSSGEAGRLEDVLIVD